MSDEGSFPRIADLTAAELQGRSGEFETGLEVHEYATVVAYCTLGPTRMVHVWDRRFNLAAEGYEPVW